MYLVWRDKASKELPQVALVLRKGSSIERSGGKIKLAIGLESKKKIRQRLWHCRMISTNSSYR